MNPVTRFRELSDEQQRYVRIGFSVLAGIVLILLFFGYNRQTVADPAAVTTATTIAPPATQPDGDPEGFVDEPLPSGEYEGIPTVSTTIPRELDDSEDEGEGEEGFSDSAMTAADAERVWPAAESGLPSSERDQLSAQARALVTAKITGIGRDQFPTVFGEPADEGSNYITNFKIAFAVSMNSDFTQNGEPLYRTIVGWSGEDSGLIFSQVRNANYFIKRDGVFLAVPQDKLPVALQRTDGLLGGLVIRGN